MTAASADEGADSDWEYAPLRISPDVNRVTAAAQLSLQAELLSRGQVHYLSAAETEATDRMNQEPLSSERVMPVCRAAAAKPPASITRVSR